MSDAVTASPHLTGCKDVQNCRLSSESVGSSTSSESSKLALSMQKPCRSKDMTRAVLPGDTEEVVRRRTDKS